MDADISPFFALLASQELAQKYLLTTDTAVQASLRQAEGYPVHEVLWSHPSGGIEITLWLSR